MKPTSKQSTDRQRWDHTHTAKEFHKRHGYKKYTMMFNQTIEAEMVNKALPKEWRVLLASRRYAWGNLSDYAVDAMPPRKDVPTDPQPRPLTQERLGQMLGLSKSQMSKVSVFLKAEGYWRKDHPYIFPEEEVSLLESEGKFGVGSYSSDSCSPYLRFEQFVLTAKPEIGRIIADLDKERKQHQEEARAATKVINDYKRQILGLYRDIEREKEGEDLANCDFTYLLESGSNSKLEKFSTPSPTVSESEPHSKKNANKKPDSSTPPLKSLKLEDKITAGGGDPLPNRASAPPPPLLSHSSPDYEHLTEVCGRYGLEDEAGLTRLISNVQTARSDASLSEIAHFVAVLGEKKRKQGDRKPLAGVLIKSTADYFQGKSFDQYRARQAAHPESSPETAETAEEITAHWRERWDAHPEEREDIQRMMPDIEFPAVEEKRRA